MNKIMVHLKTVLKHKKEVFKLMSKVGMPIQGLLHDMSKFTPIEFMESIKYANGKRSPVEISREVNGYSKAWLHHKGRNKHHWEYWVDKYLDGGVGCIMPYRYAVEMFCDMVAASKVYKGKNFTTQCPLDYYNSHDYKQFMHPMIKEFLSNMFSLYVKVGDSIEKEAARFIYDELQNKYGGK